MPKSQQSSSHDDSAYGGQKFDVEKNQFPEEAAAPELQLNRKGLGMTSSPTLLGPPCCYIYLIVQLLCGML